MKIRFQQSPIGRDYKKGDEVEFNGRVEEGYARKYVDRGWAIDISPKLSEATAEEVEAKRLADEAAAEAQRLQGEADRLNALGSIVIPEAWADLPWPELRSLAASVSSEVVRSKDDAAVAIEAELKRRAG